jgi:hypothetical protein
MEDLFNSGFMRLTAPIYSITKNTGFANRDGIQNNAADAFIMPLLKISDNVPLKNQ